VAVQLDKATVAGFGFISIYVYYLDFLGLVIYGGGGLFSKVADVAY
jgi:hypothetical protein